MVVVLRIVRKPAYVDSGRRLDMVGPSVPARGRATAYEGLYGPAWFNAEPGSLNVDSRGPGEPAGARYRGIPHCRAA